MGFVVEVLTVDIGLAVAFGEPPPPPQETSSGTAQIINRKVLERPCINSNLIYTCIRYP
jgi:hypothetical protein